MSTATVAIDPRRLARAIHLDCQQEGPDTFRVWGGAQSHTVEFSDVTRCDCADFTIHGSRCKHLLRISLSQGDSEVIKALRSLVALPQTRRSGSETRRG